LGINIKYRRCYSFHTSRTAVETGNTSSCKDHRELSHDHDSENVSNLRLHFAAKSAPNSIFSSPVTSPRRSSNVDFYDILKVSPAKTAQSPDRSPLRSPGSHLNQEGSQLHKFSSRVWPENNHVDANPHPLPLPPKASPQTAHSSPQHQPSIVHLNTENLPSMKGQWQKGKLIGRGSFGSVYHATNLYALLPSFYSLLCKVLNCCHSRGFIKIFNIMENC